MKIDLPLNLFTPTSDKRIVGYMSEWLLGNTDKG